MQLTWFRALLQNEAMRHGQEPRPFVLSRPRCANEAARALGPTEFAETSLFAVGGGGALAEVGFAAGRVTAVAFPRIRAATYDGMPVVVILTEPAQNPF